MRKKHKILSLFANIGVAEAYLEEIGCDVVVANEVITRRAKLYSEIYPSCKMICGDINNPEVMSDICESSIKAGVDIVMATPPCQGMSTAGQKDEDDFRNLLTLPALAIIKQVNPKYCMFENVPDYINTTIQYKGERRSLPQVIEEELGENYVISINRINTDDYSVPQTRERVIILLSRKDQEKHWQVPPKDSRKVTMRDAIGWIPEIDPYVKDLSNEEFQKLFPLYEERKKKALELSPWNIPPVHVYRQVHAMQFTPSGQTAFDNDVHYPLKENGERVKGYHNTYKRQNWDTPAYTVTMDNRKISSQNNVHPGRLIGKTDTGEDIYSDARTLTLYELMLIMSLPADWPIPVNTQEAFIRRIIGEGIPPLFVKKLYQQL